MCLSLAGDRAAFRGCSRHWSGSGSTRAATKQHREQTEGRRASDLQVLPHSSPFRGEQGESADIRPTDAAAAGQFLGRCHLL